MNECKKKLSLYCILYSTASQWANDYWNFVYRIRHLRISSSSSAHTQNTFWEFCCNFARVCVKLRKRWVPYAQPQADFRQFFFITFFFYFANQFFSVSKKFHFFLSYSAAFLSCTVETKSNWRALSFFFFKKNGKQLQIRVLCKCLVRPARLSMVVFFFHWKKNKNLMINSSLLLCYFVILIRDECQVHWMGLKVEFLIDNKIDQK